LDDERATTEMFGSTGAPQGKPTLKTISRLAGLAVPTVSRALNDAPDIGADTKKLVRQIAEELGYVPNRAGVRLRTGRTNVISLVMSTEHDVMNHTARLISSVAGELRGTPFHLNINPYFPGEDPMKPIRYIVETGSADAVIFNQTEPQDPRVAWLIEHRFPFATHGRTDWSARHAWFDFDNRRWAEQGVHRLLARGRRDILLIAPPPMQFYAQEIDAGVTAAASCESNVVHRLNGITSDSPGVDVQAAVLAHFAAHPGTNGIISSSTSATMAAVAAIESVGLRVGVDVDIYAKEAIRFLHLFRPGIMVVQEDVARAGTFLARAAIRAAREPDLPPLQGLDQPQE
jgi:LacI family transcriptional regulator